MRALSNDEVLELWERGRSLSAGWLALSLLALAEPETPVDALARLRVGARDARLFRLRQATLGDELLVTANCPSCRESLEVALTVDDLIIDGAGEVDEHVLQAGELEVRFRLPNSLDLAAIAGAPAAEQGVTWLLARCVQEVRRGGQVVARENLTDGAVAAVAEKMGELDPQADIELAMTCPQCGATWSAPFDIVSFFWSELQFWAVRLLREVHALGRAYAWRESDILAMSARRRQAYLDLLGG